ncbi:MAG TPA: malto-oligosyltrehalose trehalohydrolase [Leptolyngbyaceae cyanobacterium M65_K2018_010]|nr:malto-oligosyltrehalose trehalohydrolase [Leptolyngbyaceae cyanobacterium M65_K2018_010]
MMIGANYLGHNQCEFKVWAPHRQQVAVKVLETPERIVPLHSEPGGYWRARVEGIGPGMLYQIVLDGDRLRPDPASRCQPQGVHGPSQVVDPQAYPWGDSAWSGLPLSEYILYEIHVGTFTPEGTFDAIIPRLPRIKELGITALELMPVAQFPGDRNWGYDGVYPFAVQTSYGGPGGLKRLVDACHQQGLAVVLDVVYNHFGPEGNYSADFGPYLTERYTTPWGAAINFDDAYSDGVRQFVLDNASYWLRDYHIDGLRLDAVHAIYDFSATHILAELKTVVEPLAWTRGYPCHLMAESDLNDVRVINPADQGGHGLDAQWSDDFHHSLHTLLTGESQGYYEDFGSPEQLAKALQDSFVYDGLYSRFRKRRHGNRASHRPPQQFIVCAQNHDQVGNRPLGERLSTLVSFEGLKLAAAAVLLSPYIPLLFMGEEYGETAPFLYFIDHGDPDLVAAVRAGRQREFAAFHGWGDPPDAASPDTFQRAQLQWDLQQQGKHHRLWRFYQTLIQLRRQIPALATGDRGQLATKCTPARGLVCWQRWQGTSEVLALMNFQPETVPYTPLLDGRWQRCLDTADVEWLGPGSQNPDILQTGGELRLSAQSLVLYQRIPSESPANLPALAP